MITPEEREEIESNIKEMKQKSDLFREKNIPKKKKQNIILQYAHLGIEFIAIFLVFLFAGDYLDKRLLTAPWFTLLGVVIGFALAMVRIVQVSKKLERELDE